MWGNNWNKILHKYYGNDFRNFRKLFKIYNKLGLLDKVIEINDKNFNNKLSLFSRKEYKKI